MKPQDSSEKIPRQCEASGFLTEGTSNIPVKLVSTGKEISHQCEASEFLIEGTDNTPVKLVSTGKAVHVGQ